MEWIPFGNIPLVAVQLSSPANDLEALKLTVLTTSHGPLELLLEIVSVTPLIACPLMVHDNVGSGYPVALQ